MIRFKQFQFSTAPNTGEQWFLRAAEIAGLGSAEEKSRRFVRGMIFSGRFVHEPFMVDQSRLRVALVRSPFTWLESLFLCGVPSFYLGSEFDILRGVSHFPEFIGRYLKKIPGSITRIMLRDADTYMRFEDFPLAFSEFARSLGTPEELLKDPFFQVRPLGINHRPVWEKGQKSDVFEAEMKFIEQFDYWY